MSRLNRPAFRCTPDVDPLEGRDLLSVAAGSAPSPNTPPPGDGPEVVIVVVADGFPHHPHGSPFGHDPGSGYASTSDPFATSGAPDAPAPPADAPPRPDHFAFFAPPGGWPWHARAAIEAADHMAPGPGPGSDASDNGGDPGPGPGPIPGATDDGGPHAMSPMMRYAEARPGGPLSWGRDQSGPVFDPSAGPPPPHDHPGLAAWLATVAAGGGAGAGEPGDPSADPAIVSGPAAAPGPAVVAPRGSAGPVVTGGTGAGVGQAATGKASVPTPPASGSAPSGAVVVDPGGASAAAAEGALAANPDGRSPHAPGAHAAVAGEGEGEGEGDCALGLAGLPPAPRMADLLTAAGVPFDRAALDASLDRFLALFDALGEPAAEGPTRLPAPLVVTAAVLGAEALRRWRARSHPRPYLAPAPPGLS